MTRFRTRFLYAFERGRPISGWAVRLGRFGTVTFLRHKAG